MATVLRDMRPGDAGWVIMRHAAYYHETHGFAPEFEAVVARVLADFIDGRRPDTDRGWIAAAPDGTREGCIFCVRLDDETAQLRLFFVDPACRGTGLGSRLLWACISHAAATGHRRLKLWTHAEQAAAGALYARAGFVVTEAERRRSFGVEAEVRTLVLDLGRLEATRSALLQ